MKLGFQIHHAKDDADCLIVKTTLDVAASSTTVLIGEDTDLLVLLLYHVTDNLHGVYIMPSGRKAKLWDIKTARAKIGTETCKRLLFAHAISGCDTTSRMMNIGKSLPVKLLRKSILFQKIADVFMAANIHQGTEEAGEKAVVLLYGGEEKDSLNHLRYVKYVQKVAISNKSFQPSSLPPSSSAAKYHCFRVYFQVQAWENLNDAYLDPRQWGWKVDNHMLLPMLTDLPAAPEELLTVIRCNCQTDCSTTRCTCRIRGLVCTAACGHCRGETCVNVAPVNHDYEQDDEIDEEQRKGNGYVRYWLSFELKSLQKSAYAPCSEKNEGLFFCEQERRKVGWGGGGGRGRVSVEEGDTWGFRERLKTPHLFSKAFMSKTNMSIELSAVCLYFVHLHLFLCFVVVSNVLRDIKSSMKMHVFEIYLIHLDVFFIYSVSKCLMEA